MVRFLICLAALFIAKPLAAAEHPPGLYVRNGVLMREGKPYQGIGANYFDLFYRLLREPEEQITLTNLTRLSKAGIPFVRFTCGGFWPAEQRMYLTNRAEFFRRLDLVVQTAEQAHIGLIPSLFWHVSTLPDLAGEPLDQLGNPDSKTIALLRQYTEDVVTRYRASPALWGWEFGNEYNLGADLPNAAQHRPAIVPRLGTPPSRTERDELKTTVVTNALIIFARTVRRIDPDRIVEAGHSIPRASAWHNSRENNWKADTAEQFGEVLQRDNPSPLDVISIHLYPGKDSKYSGPASSIDEAVAAAMKWSSKTGKPLFIGEFGAPRELGGDKARLAFQELLNALRKHQVPLAAFWVFDLKSQDRDWNVTFENDRAGFIELIAKANR